MDLPESIYANLPNGSRIYMGEDRFVYSNPELTILSELVIDGIPINETDPRYREYVIESLQDSGPVN